MDHHRPENFAGSLSYLEITMTKFNANELWIINRVVAARVSVEKTKCLSVAMDCVTIFTTRTNVKEEDVFTTRRTVTPFATVASAISHSHSRRMIASLYSRKVNIIVSKGYNFSNEISIW